MTEHPMLVIQLYPWETYQDSLLRRLAELGITQAAICAKIGVDPSQFSRWVARPSERTGRPVDIGSGTVVSIEAAIETIRIHQERERQRQRKRGVRTQERNEGGAESVSGARRLLWPRRRRQRRNLPVPL